MGGAKLHSIAENIIINQRKYFKDTFQSKKVLTLSHVPMSVTNVRHWHNLGFYAVHTVMVPINYGFFKNKVCETRFLKLYFSNL